MGHPDGPRRIPIGRAAAVVCAAVIGIVALIVVGPKSKNAVDLDAPVASLPKKKLDLILYGTQGEQINFSAEEKLRIALRFDELHFHYIEGGWPGSNPKDAEFFRRARHLTLNHARLAAFGMTCLRTMVKTAPTSGWLSTRRSPSKSFMML